MSENFYWGLAALVTLGILYLGTLFQPLLTAFHILVCLLLILIVLLQSGRAADLAGAFGGAGSQTAFGPRGAATLLSKGTTFLAVVFMVTSLVLAVYASRPRTGGLTPSDQPTPPATEQTTPAETEPSPAESQTPPSQGETSKPPTENPPPSQE